MKYIFLLVFVLFAYTPVSAQWISNNQINTTVCDTTGEQGLSKIAGIPGGGCYISWFDARSGSYAVYLQRLDPLGNKMFGNNGLLVSGNAQSTSLVDWDMKTDAAGNAIIAFTDVRNGGNLNPFAYLISPSGQFLWGANGVDLNQTTEYQANPVVTQAGDGNYYVAWIIATSPNKVGLHKISSNGTKLWPAPLVLTGSGEGFSRPVVLPTDSNCVLLFHTGQTGTSWAPNVKLRVNKIAPDGTLKWGQYGMYYQDLGKVNPYTTVKIVSDGNNGAVIGWYGDQDSDNLQEAYVQRISSTGSMYFPMNGAAVSTTAEITSANTVVAFNPATNETYAFYYQTNSGQTTAGMFIQKFNQSGVRQWTDDGVAVAPLVSLVSYLNQQIHFAGDKAMIFWIEGGSGGVNTKVLCNGYTPQGTTVWPSPIVVSETSQEKLHMVSYIDEFKGTKLSWTDTRTSDRGIYAQNVNKDGTLGSPVVPVELTSFTSSLSGKTVQLNWATATETNNKGFEVERRIKNEELKINNWEFIGFVKGNGTLTTPSKYSYTEVLSPGVYQYRLKQIDFNGSYTYSAPVEVEVSGVPSDFTLLQNYPNPFNPETKINYQLPVNSKALLKVYDIMGNEIAVLVNEEKPAGSHSVNFNASQLPSGMYFAKLTANGKSSVIKMSLLK